LFIDDAWIAVARESLPELPQVKEARYREAFGLSPVEAAALAEDRAVAEWYDAVVVAAGASGRPKTAANWILNDLFRLMNERGRAITDISVTPTALVELLALVDGGDINLTSARDVLAEM